MVMVVGFSVMCSGQKGLVDDPVPNTHLISSYTAY